MPIEDQHNSIMPTKDGPLHLTGDLEICGKREAEAWLCRCGLSQNKPYCDGSHRGAGFSDPGVLASGETTLESDGSKLSVQLAKDGPILVNGYFRVLSSDGQEVARAKKAALCRCGSSQNKPYCDGSHKLTGFKAD